MSKATFTDNTVIQKQLGKIILSLNDASNEVVIQGMSYFLKQLRLPLHKTLIGPNGKRQDKDNDVSQSEEDRMQFRQPQLNAIAQAYYHASPKFSELFSAFDKPAFSSGGKETITLLYVFVELLKTTSAFFLPTAITVSKKIFSSRYVRTLQSAFNTAVRPGYSCAVLQLLTKIAQLRQKSLARQMIHCFHFSATNFLKLGQQRNLRKRKKPQELSSLLSPENNDTKKQGEKEKLTSPTFTAVLCVLCPCIDELWRTRCTAYPTACQRTNACRA
jgi:hypothetical protein